MVAIIVWHKFNFVCAKSMTSQLVESSALSRRDYRQSAKKVEYAKGFAFLTHYTHSYCKIIMLRKFPIATAFQSCLYIQFHRISVVAFELCRVGLASVLLWKPHWSSNWGVLTRSQKAESPVNTFLCIFIPNNFYKI